MSHRVRIYFAGYCWRFGFTEHARTRLR